METVLVTGGAGFIGSHLVEGLLKKGYAVIVLDNLFTGNKENLSAVMDQIEFVEGDIRDKELVEKLMAKADYVLHEAARTSVPRSLNEPKEYHDVNVNGTIILLEAARKNNVKSFVIASSSSVYGDVKEFPQKETLLKTPLSPYAITKLTGEYYLYVYSQVYGLNTIALRYFNVFGPRQDPNSQYSAVIPLFIKSVMNEKSPTIYGDGKQSRDFTYVATVVEANILAMESTDCKGEVFNIAKGDSITVNSLFENICDLVGKNIESIHADIRKGDIYKSQADNTKAKNKLGFTGTIEFKEGLKKTVDWFKEHPEALKD